MFTQPGVRDHSHFKRLTADTMIDDCDPDDIPERPFPTFEETYEELFKRAIHAPVQAYYRVYGHWPDGYPPRLDEY